MGGVFSHVRITPVCRSPHMISKATQGIYVWRTVTFFCRNMIQWSANNRLMSVSDYYCVNYGAENVTVVEFSSPIFFRISPNFFRSYDFYSYICIVKMSRLASVARHDKENQTFKVHTMKLTAKEEEIMAIFWEHGEMFIRDILKYIPEPKPSYNTVATQVKFLEDKGFLTRKPIANTFLYVPAISEKEYSGQTIGNVVRQYYNNSYASVVSQFVEEEKMDLDELKALIAEIEKRRK